MELRVVECKRVVSRESELEGNYQRNSDYRQVYRKGIYWVNFCF